MVPAPRMVDTNVSTDTFVQSTGWEVSAVIEDLSEENDDVS
jgi:hypothetical protein